MVTELMEFLRPVLAEVEAAGLVGWRVSSADVGGSARLSRSRRDVGIEYDAGAAEDLRWCVWMTGTTPVQGATLVDALAAARAEGWS